MSTYSGSSETTITSEQLIQRHTVMALMKSAEQQRVANVLAAERLLIEHPQTNERIQSADIQEALGDRVPISPNEFVSRAMDDGETNNQEWMSDARIEDGEESARGRVFVGEIYVREEFPGETAEIDRIVIGASNARHVVTRLEAIDLSFVLNVITPTREDGIDPIIRHPVSIAPGRRYWVSSEQASILKHGIAEVLAQQDEALLAKSRGEDPAIAA